MSGPGHLIRSNREVLCTAFYEWVPRRHDSCMSKLVGSAVYVAFECLFGGHMVPGIWMKLKFSTSLSLPEAGPIVQPVSHVQPD